MVRTALLRFSLLTLVAMVTVGAGTAVVSGKIAEDEAIRDAAFRTADIAHRVAAPLVNQDLRQLEPDAMDAITDALLDQLRDGSVVHIVIYDVRGRVLWSEDPALVGQAEEFSSDVRAAVSSGRGALVKDVRGHPLAGPSLEFTEDSLIEVYVGSRDAQGEPFILEAYTPRATIQVDAEAVFRGLLPLTLGSLLLLGLITLPLALSLARRIDRSAQQRATMLRRALRSWHQERERLAQALHDDVIQDLSAMSYALPAVLEPLPADDAGRAARATGQRMNRLLISSLDSLRSVLTDLVPLGFDGRGLEQALQSLAQASRDRGLPVDLVVDRDPGTGQTAGGLVFRVVREGLRNIEKHAGATSATVTVRRRGAEVVVTIDDDGQGFRDRGSENGHVGLQLLAQSVQYVGGTLELEDIAGGGTRLMAVVPARLPELDEDLSD